MFRLASRTPGAMKPKESAPSPYSPAMRKLSGWVQAIHIGGGGFWMGLGVTCRRPFGDADGVVEGVGQERHAVADADVLRSLARRGQEDLRRRGVGVLGEEVVLDLPQVVEA